MLRDVWHAGCDVKNICCAVLQEDNGIPVHLKGGTADALLYRTTMALTVLGEKTFLSPVWKRVSTVQEMQNIQHVFFCLILHFHVLTVDCVHSDFSANLCSLVRFEWDSTTQRFFYEFWSGSLVAGTWSDLRLTDYKAASLTKRLREINSC